MSFQIELLGDSCVSITLGRVMSPEVNDRCRVYMLGFLPGFACLGTVDARIAMPRLDAADAEMRHQEAMLGGA